MHLLDVVEALYVKVESALPVRDCRYYQQRSWEQRPVPANRIESLPGPVKAGG